MKVKKHKKALKSFQIAASILEDEVEGVTPDILLMALSVYEPNKKTQSVSLPGKVISIKNTAERLECSTRHIYTLIKRGQLKAAKIGFKRGVRVLEQSILDLQTGDQR